MPPAVLPAVRVLRGLGLIFGCHQYTQTSCIGHEPSTQAALAAGCITRGRAGSTGRGGRRMALTYPLRSNGLVKGA